MSDGEPTTQANGPSAPCISCGTMVQATAKSCPRCGVRQIPVGAEPPRSPPTAPPGSAPGAYGAPGSYAQPGYPASGYPGGYPTPGYPMAGYAPRNNSKAVTALVLGIAGLVVCQILSIFAIIVGKEAEREIRYSGGTQTGEGLAMAGRILGWIGVLLLFVVVVAVFAIVFLGTTAPR